MNKKARILFVIVTIFGSIFTFSHSAYATDISISNSGKVSFGKVQPSSVGTVVTGEDTVNVTTDCSSGANIYVTSTNGGSTSMVNSAANSNNTIAISSASSDYNYGKWGVGRTKLFGFRPPNCYDRMQDARWKDLDLW